MFGYVKTDTPNMFVKDTVLYRAMYCGLCKSIGAICGQKGRFALNYDLAFLSLFIHNLADVDVKIEKQTCVIRWFVKKPVAVVDDLSKRIGALNIIMAYYKLNDDVIDSKKGRCKRAFFRSSYKKAAKTEPVLDGIVKDRYAELLKLEKTNCDSIDIAADPFGKMMSEISKELLGDKSSKDSEEFSYQLGKWVYLIDALDDFDKDKLKKNFNVFLNAYPEIGTKKELMDKKGGEIQFVFGNLLSDLHALSGKLNYRFNHDLIDNIIDNGLFKETKRVMEGKDERKL